MCTSSPKKVNDIGVLVHPETLITRTISEVTFGVFIAKWLQFYMHVKVFRCTPWRRRSLVTNFKKRFLRRIVKIFLDFSGHPVAKYVPIIVKFSVTKKTEGPLRLAEFDVPRATFGDSQPPEIPKITDFHGFCQVCAEYLDHISTT